MKARIGRKEVQVWNGTIKHSNRTGVEVHVDVLRVRLFLIGNF